MATHSSIFTWKIPWTERPGWGYSPWVAKSQTRLMVHAHTHLFWWSYYGAHSSALAWRTPWMAEPGRLQSMGSRRVGHDWATSLSHIGEGNGNPLQRSCLENPRDRGAWWAAVCGVAQSRTRLKWLRRRRRIDKIHSHNTILYASVCVCVQTSNPQSYL